MQEHEWLAESFEAKRGHLRAVAYRMLGSLSEAEDAVQETWLRLSRADTGNVENLGGWLTTVVARVCLDMLRSRKSRREEPLAEFAPGPTTQPGQGVDPEQEAVLADSVGLAMLVVLEVLTPAERLAFVLHDMFAVPFDEIAPIVGRSPAAARQLASRARRRVRGTDAVTDANLPRKRQVIDAFLSAARRGDFAGLLALLDPDVVLQTDGGIGPADGPREIRGAEQIARNAIQGGARAAQPALVNGSVGVVVAPRGKLLMVLDFTVVEEKVVRIDAIMDREHLQSLDLAIFDD